MNIKYHESKLLVILDIPSLSDDLVLLGQREKRPIYKILVLRKFTAILRSFPVLIFK